MGTADTRDVALDFRGKIKIGKFIDRERPTYSEAMTAHLRKVLGEKYVPYEGVQ